MKVIKNNYPYFFLLGVEQIFNTCFCIKLLVIHYFLGYFIYTIFPYSLKIITTFTVFLTLLEPIEHFNRYINSGFKLFLLWIFIFHTFEILQGITFIFILPIITYISTHIYPFQYSSSHFSFPYSYQECSLFLQKEVFPLVFILEQPDSPYIFFFFYKFVCLFLAVLGIHHCVAFL